MIPRAVQKLIDAADEYERASSATETGANSDRHGVASVYTTKGGEVEAMRQLDIAHDKLIIAVRAVRKAAGR